MPALLLHLTALERLALQPERLPPTFGRALGRDLEYARLGAALPELPLYAGLRGTLDGFFAPRGVPEWYERFHEREPALFGLKMAELVAAGALVGFHAGRAFVAGYFTHLCLDRHLHPLTRALAERHKTLSETLLQAQRRIEWAQALFYVREVHGASLLGTTSLLGRFQFQKRSGPPRGIGGGLYELVRVAAHETLHAAPTKAEVDGWLRGLYLHALLLSSPIGRRRALPSRSNLSYRELYRGPEADVATHVAEALDDARRVLGKVAGYMERGVFTPRARRRLLELVPGLNGDAPHDGRMSAIAQVRRPVPDEVEAG